MGFYDDMYDLRDYLLENKNEKGARVINQAIKKLTTYDLLDDNGVTLKTFEKRGRKILADTTMDPDIKELVYAENQLICNILRAKANKYETQKKKQERALAAHKTKKKTHAQQINSKKFEQESKQIIDTLSGRSKPQEPTYNTGCKHYCEYDGEPYCGINMDTTFCTGNCAYATNTAGSLKAI